MKNHDTPSRRRHIDSPGDPFFGPDPQLPELALEMPDMRFAERLQTHILHYLKQPDQPRAQLRRKGLDFGIGGGDGFTLQLM